MTAAKRNAKQKDVAVKKQTPAKKRALAPASRLDATIGKAALLDRVGARTELAPRLRRWLENSAGITAAWSTATLAPDARGVLRPAAQYVVIDGDVGTDANIVVGDARHSAGILIVLGDLRCKNLAVPAGWTLVCTGSLTAAEVVVASAADSCTLVGTGVRARVVVSGAGAWLELHAPPENVRAAITHYVMAEGAIFKPVKRAAVGELFVPPMLDGDSVSVSKAIMRISANEPLLA